MFCIFGYSAPTSDAEAVAMLKKAWGNVDDRKMEEIELIDIREEDAVIDSWNHLFIRITILIIPVSLIQLWLDVREEVVKQLLID